MNRDYLRIVHLFGKAYWWDRDTDGRLVLAHARWIEDRNVW